MSPSEGGSPTCCGALDGYTACARRRPPTAADAVRGTRSLGAATAVPRLPASTVPKPALLRVLRLDGAYRWWFGHGFAGAHDRRAADLVLDRSLGRHAEGHLSGPDVEVPRDDPPPRGGILRRPAARRGQGRGDAPLPRRVREQTRHPNENFARGDGAPHVGSRSPIGAARRRRDGGRAGWVARIPAIESTMRRLPARGSPRSSSRRHDARRPLGKKSNLDLDGALEPFSTVRPPPGSSPPRYAALVGTRPDGHTDASRRPSSATVDRSADRSDRGAAGLPCRRLGEHRHAVALRSSSDSSRLRTPPTSTLRRAHDAPGTGYVPFFPPNPGGYPKGVALLARSNSSTPSTSRRPRVRTSTALRRSSNASGSTTRRPRRVLRSNALPMPGYAHCSRWARRSSRSDERTARVPPRVPCVLEVAGRTAWLASFITSNASA